jgi:hypothetical protein
MNTNSMEKELFESFQPFIADYNIEFEINEWLQSSEKLNPENFQRRI